MDQVELSNLVWSKEPRLRKFFDQYYPRRWYEWIIRVFTGKWPNRRVKTKGLVTRMIELNNQRQREDYLWWEEQIEKKNAKS